MNVHFSSEQLPRRYAQGLSLDIPQGDIQPAQGAHQYLSSTVKSMTVGRLVNVLDVGGVPADETFAKVDKGAFDGFRVAFQRGFTPSDDALRDDQPVGTRGQLLRR